ncbi:MAG: hypothetical protein ABH840_04180 [Nanoarchaeota archaeon]
MKIGIDIDNVVVDLSKGFCDFYNLSNGKGIKLDDFEGYYLTSFLPIKKEEEYTLWKKYHDSDYFDEMGLLENAKGVIDMLKREHELVFITARHPEWKDKTIKFFQKHFPEDDFEILFSGDEYQNGKGKKEICDERGINLIIEDHHEKSKEYASEGIKVLLMSMPWNKSVEHENIIKINNWNQVPGIIKNIGLKNDN